MPAPSLALAFHALRTWCELINSRYVQGDVCVCVFLPEQSSRLGSWSGVRVAEGNSSQAPPSAPTVDPSQVSLLGQAAYRN